MWDNLIGNVTTVGSNGGPSVYGTYDQSGNVYEWTDSVASSTSSARRGGAWDNSSFVISKSFRSFVAGSTEYISTGFRIATSINPSSLPNFVLVGDSDNATDDTGYGSVTINYRICRYTVTNCEYAAFLNAVAKSDTYGLYNTAMANTVGGITRSGINGNYIYTVKANYENKPVIYVSWWDAARYCNWLHNKVANPSTTTINSGVYGVGPSVSGTLPLKDSAAWYWLPTEDQWYKAAYYKGGGSNVGYWSYSTQSDNDPAAVSADSIGNGLINGQSANTTLYFCP